MQPVDEALQKGAPGASSKDARGPVDVLMLDLLSIVPYYDAYLCRELARIAGINVHLAAITYHLDRECYARAGVQPEVAVDIIGRIDLPKLIRQPVKAVEYAVNLASLTKRLRRKSADVLHIQYLPFANQGLRYELGAVRKWQRSGVRVVYTVHDLLPHDSGKRFRKLYGELYGAVDQLICHNDSTRDRLTAEFAIDAERISVIPHGPLFFDCTPPSSVNVKQRYDIAEHQKIVLWQGIIHPYKGIEFLLEAWSELSGHEELVLVIAGSGGTADLASIRKQVSDRHLGTRVRLDFRFLDVSEMLALYDAAQMVVYPYKAITTSGALSTGLSQGKAIIATAQPPFMEVLRDGENALLINYGDASALANAIDRLASDSQLRDSIGAGARRSVAGDTAWHAIAEATAGCYRTVLARLGRRSGSRDYTF